MGSCVSGDINAPVPLVRALLSRGVPIDRFVHLGGELSGSDARADRASISGKIDHLRGLKENVTMGRLILAGTGFEFYRPRADVGRRAATTAAAH